MSTIDDRRRSAFIKLQAHIDRLKAEKAELVEALVDCEHIMNISANQLCTQVSSTELSALNRQLAECVIRARTAINKD